MLETWAKGSFSHSLGVHKTYLSPSLSFVLLSSEAVLCACSFMIVQRQLRFHLHFQPGFTSADKINPPCLILPVCMCQLHMPIRRIYSTYTYIKSRRWEWMMMSFHYEKWCHVRIKANWLHFMIISLVLRHLATSIPSLLQGHSRK